MARIHYTENLIFKKIDANKAELIAGIQKIQTSRFYEDVLVKVLTKEKSQNFEPKGSEKDGFNPIEYLSKNNVNQVQFINKAGYYETDSLINNKYKSFLPLLEENNIKTQTNIAHECATKIHNKIAIDTFTEYCKYTVTVPDNMCPAEIAKDLGVY